MHPWRTIVTTVFGATFVRFPSEDGGKGVTPSSLASAKTELKLNELVVVPSTANGVTHRSESPEHQPNYEHNHSNCPQNRDTGDKANEKKYKSEDNHDASK